MKLFWSLFSIDLLIYLILLYFFLTGLGDGSVSSYNLSLWLPLILVPAAILWGGLHLRRIGRPGAGKALLALLAIPGGLIGGWMLLLVILFETHPGAYR